MPTEIEHIFRPVGKTFEMNETLVVNAGPESLKLLDGLQLSVKWDEAQKFGELLVGNQTLPDSWISVVKYPNRALLEAGRGIEQDHHQPIRFSGNEILEVRSPQYTDRLVFAFRETKTSSIGNIPPRSAA